MILSAFWPLYQYLWTVYFVVMALCGFWAIFFLSSFVVPLWLTEGLAEYFGWINKSFDPEKVRYQRLYEQEGVELVYRKPTEDMAQPQGEH